MRYAILITEETRPLITVLNGGIEPRADMNNHYFVFDASPPETTENHQIVGDKSEVLSSDQPHIYFMQ